MGKTRYQHEIAVGNYEKRKNIILVHSSCPCDEG
jgi:hypothetical protein